MMILLWSPDEPMYLQYDINNQQNINVHIVKSSPITPESIAIKKIYKINLKIIKKSFEDIDLKNLKLQNMTNNINKFEKLVSTPEFIFQYNKRKNMALYHRYQRYDTNFNLIKIDYEKYLLEREFINSKRFKNKNILY